MDGLRIKIQHKGIQKLCSVCYGHHLRKDCTEEKLSWADYVTSFRSGNPEISDDFYGKWIDLVKKVSIKRPSEKDFNLPTTKDECEKMLNLMTACGIDRAKSITMLKERKEKFEQAVKEYKSQREQNAN